MSSRPLIGIAPTILKNRNIGKSEIIGTYRSYIESVEKAGGEAIILSPSLDQVGRYSKLIDGLLLTGGGDIHPKFFGKRLPKKMKLSLSPESRTRFELALIKTFLKRKRPILGICLGCQTLNIALGGTLVQDLPTERPGTRDHTNGFHDIFVIPRTQLAKLLKKKKARVNSRHHQALGRLGRELTISAVSKDAVIEAIESRTHPFAMGIQWHPEAIGHRKESKTLFSAFVKACIE